MRTLFYTIFLLFLCISLTFAQKTEKRVYIISVINQPQKVELIELSNGKYSGNVITEITKGKWKGSWLNHIWKKLWNIKPKEIIDKNPINESTVKELMSELKENGIETIKDCSEDEECKKYMFLDSGSIRFKIKSFENEREYGFDEIHPLTENNKEKIRLRFKAQNLITILYKHIDLKQNFSDLFNRLPKGHYYWYQSSGNAFVTIKNRKRNSKNQ